MRTFFTPIPRQTCRLYQVVIVIVCSSFFLLISNVAAEVISTTSTSTADIVSPDIIAPAAAAPTSDRRLTLSPTAQTRITNLTANLSNRLDAHVRRQANVLGRLQSRLNITAAAGTDVLAASSTCSEATATLEKAKAELNTIDQMVSQFIQSENPRAHWLKLRTTYSTIYTDLVSAHSLTQRCLLALETALVPLAATSTPATTTNPQS